MAARRQPLADRREDPRPIRFRLTTPQGSYQVAVPAAHARKGLPGFPLVPLELIDGGSVEMQPLKEKE